ncbi:MAG: hypothetical protein F6K19_20995 [Cyanothece sp. SIO1E1]|nr:hypothetical protein [Cyanothece sp. SIO1E1]
MAQNKLGTQELISLSAKQVCIGLFGKNDAIHCQAISGLVTAAMISSKLRLLNWPLLLFTVKKGIEYSLLHLEL